MTESPKLIDEVLERYWRQEVQVACGNLDQANYEAFKAGWQAARDHYAPKLSEEDAVDIAEKASMDKWRGTSLDTKEGWKAYIAEIIKALAAAGVRFKEQRVEGSE